MYELMIYSLKVGVCLAVFYLFFKLLLSRETFHRFNRIVVLAAMVLSFVLPFCVITIYRELPAFPEISEAEPVMASVAEPLAQPVPWEMLAGGAFLVGAVATLLWTFGLLCGVMRLIRQGRRERLKDGVVLVHTCKTLTPFSWGRYIVMSETDLAENGEAILSHERAHLRLRHSLDLIVTDLAGCLQWFNPAMWLLRRELRAIHEYEADKAVLNSGIDAKSYQLLLIKKAAGGRWYSVANSFNHSKLKNRITMMLCKKSSRWAGAKALLLLPLTAVALGAFAETAYVFPEDKGKKENVTIHIEGRTFPSDKQQPLILVDGKAVKKLDDLDPSRIATITVLKDSTSIVKYGEEGKYGVVLVTLKKGDGSDHEAQISELKGKIVKIDTTDATDANVLQEVRVIGYGVKPKNWTVDSMSTVVVNGNRSNVRFSGVNRNPAYIVDGVQVYEIESLQPSKIMSVSVTKGPGIPPELADKGYDEVITITTKRVGVEAQKIALDAARKGLELARKHMSSDAWQEAQQALVEAEKKFADAQKNSEGAGVSTGDNITRKNRDIAEPEGSVTVYKGRVTLDGGLPDDLLIYINGKRASKKEVEQLKEGKIKRMEVYKGDEAVKRYGDKGRNGVVEIRVRK